MSTALVVISVLLGATLQRISGIGFAIVSAPFMVIALGPIPGIIVVQCCGVIAAIMVMIRVWDDIEWKRYLQLLPPTFLGVACGSILAPNLPQGVAQVCVGVILVASLLTLAVQRRRSKSQSSGQQSINTQPPATPKDSLIKTAIAGGAAGFITPLAGAGGVAMSVYQRAIAWDQRRFLATVQPFFVTLSAVTVVSLLITTTDMPLSFPLSWWLMVLATIITGLILGELGARRFSSHKAANITLAVSWIGAIIAIVDGVAKTIGTFSGAM